MFDVDKARVPIKDRQGRLWGHIDIHLLPGERAGGVAPLLDRQNDPELEPGMAAVQLLEGHEYRYVIVPEIAEPHRPVSTDRPEIFRPDDEAGLTGRIRPGLYTGTLPVTVLVDGRPVGVFQLEVRASKLDYLSHYRWMLRDLADTFAEVIMRRFAPSEARFTFRVDADAPTLYQRFAFLKSIIEDDTLENAVTQILSSPHREWREEEELRPIGQSIPSGPMVARAVVRSGPRVPWDGGSALGLHSLPACMPVVRTFETYDTLPNRFVKHALMQWRNTVADIADALAGAADSTAKERGMAEAEGVLSHLDEVLAQPFFRHVGPLTQSPADNQVLQKRAGYRDVYKLYIQSELAAMLTWSGGEDVYRAGQKDVAVLYEYWVFVQLAHVVSDMCQQPLQLEQLLEDGPDGLDLRLKRGRHRVLKGTVRRRGRTLAVELWYNRTFARGARHGSWTRRLRPDCSLRIQVPGYEGAVDEQWIHFDAKYRVDSLMEIFADDIDDGVVDDRAAAEPGEVGVPGKAGEPDETEGAAPSDRVGAARPVTDDLLKMHAYRDAIRRSSGAYVVYPGMDGQLLYRYHEILPGLGAFALRPVNDGPAAGVDAIRRFISEVMDHAASQLTQHERYRFWKETIFANAPTVGERARVGAVSFLTRPPADTRVLLGYVRNDEHFRWIQQTGLYNVRADQRTGSVGLHSEQLAAEIVVLYGPDLERPSLWRVSGDPRLMTDRRMMAMGYPNPRGSLYYCLPVEPIVDGAEVVGSLTFASALDLVGELAPDSPYGAPIATTWSRLVQWLAVHGE